MCKNFHLGRVGTRFFIELGKKYLAQLCLNLFNYKAESKSIGKE